MVFLELIKSPQDKYVWIYCGGMIVFLEYKTSNFWAYCGGIMTFLNKPNLNKISIFWFIVVAL